MSRTRALLCATLGCDLGNLANAYFIPTNTKLRALGKSGCFEKCALLLDPYDVENANIGACRRGYLDIVRHLCLFAHQTGRIIEAAYRGGYSNVIAFVTTNMNRDTDYYLRRALWGACRGGHLELAREVFENPKTKLDGIDLGLAIVGATVGRHIKLIKLLLAHGAQYYDDLLTMAHCSRCRDANIAEFLASYGNKLYCPGCGSLISQSAKS